MNAAWVIDSSIGISWVHPAQATTQTDSLLEEVAAGAAMFVPAFWFLEMANCLLILQRRKRLSPEERQTALVTLRGMNFIPDDESANAAFGMISDLADEHSLTVYDAAYLELALRRKLPLASRDASLVQAAKKCGLRVL
jgi:predicted nucleic acid-binding protein